MHYSLQAQQTASQPTTVTTTTTDTTATNPTTLDRPTYLLNVPFSLAVGSPNNIWMEEYSDAERQINRKRAMLQFAQLYRYLASESLVYLLPTPRGCRCQDLVYTANLGIVLAHLPECNTVVISNYSSEPRRGETEIGVNFFESMGYDVVVSPHKFEGEADLKHLRDNIYLGGYGMRTERETFDWMERTFDMKIIKVQLVEPYLYHLDCSVFPLTTEECIVSAEMFSKDELTEIEQHIGIIDVSADACIAGLTNSVRLSNTILNGSHIMDLWPGHPEYAEEKAKNRILEDICASRAFDLAYFNLSEFHKSGALLSCMVMHLNRVSYGYRLL